MVVRFGEGALVFVAETKLNRKARANAPVILHEKIVGVRTKIVSVGSKLHAALLGQAQKKIREIAARSRLLDSARILRRRKTREGKNCLRRFWTRESFAKCVGSRRQNEDYVCRDSRSPCRRSCRSDRVRGAVQCRSGLRRR